MSHSIGQYSFFDVENQMSKIHQLNNFLCRLNEAVNWEIFRDALTSVRRERIPSQGGRPPFDVILMFKILVLKATYNLSDEATELQIRDRLSFREFLGLTFADTVPDARHAKKGDEKQNHALVDVETKLVLDYTVTPASVHDRWSVWI